MKRFNPNHRLKEPHGFTLIEIIVTLVLTAIAGSILFSAMGANMRYSTDPLLSMGDQQTLAQHAESLIAQYRQQLENKTLHPKNFGRYFPTSKQNVIQGYTIDGTQINGTYISFDGEKEVAHDGSMRFLKVTLARNQLTLTTLLCR